MILGIPNGVYSETDFTEINRQIRRGLSIAGGFAFVVLAIIVATLIVRWQWATMAVTILWGGLMIFFWGMKLTPPLAYKRHLKEIHEGLSRTTEGRVVSFDEETTFREGLDYFALTVNIGDQGDPEDDRLFYWDMQKPRPVLSAADRVEIVSHGNDIIGFRSMQ